MKKANYPKYEVIARNGKYWICKGATENSFGKVAGSHTDLKKAYELAWIKNHGDCWEITDAELARRMVL